MKRKLSLLLLIPLMILALAACGNGDDHKKGDKLKVNTTVYPLKSFTEQIGGKYVDVKSIYPAGADLHSYEPTQKDMMSAAKSDLFIYTGDDLDPVAKKVASTIKKDDKKLSLQDKISKNDLLADHHHEGEEEHHHHGKYDPHIWLDPKMDQTFAKEIKDQLVKKDPDHKKYYEKNYKKLNKDLENIDKDMKDATKGKKGNAVFISHESLGYLSNRYGFEQVGVQNMSAEDPSQKDLTNIVKEIKKNKVEYILYEENVSNKITDTIRKETDAKPLKFNNMESVTKEQQNEKGLSYQSLMKENIKNIKKALDSKIKVKDEDHEHEHEHEH
ncbi:metal ABC transporter solute-binding protein, Zn/Mn family [Staphylococcus warneri]|uniref:metal ABC transporter solute-binding protein, Zn/Mn family n=1 Tax=Staphylococcus warneri TaxID=1292 RepID=UPI0034CEEB49